ncbi:hypothetical protein AB1Y20_000415 [Prymnesium parvum]|uniref:Methyltransferase FkbM domain-containing protein n=1 Tax=Prymnesium parvum TaxID=97485 RepID=A0AB34K8E4_PRYPA
MLGRELLLVISAVCVTCGAMRYVLTPPAAPPEPPRPATSSEGTCTAPPLLQSSCKLVTYGGTDKGSYIYGGWTLCSEYVTSRSTVFSVGIGGDTSFDASIARRHGARVSCFDPTINAQQFTRTLTRFNLTASERALITFYPFGLAEADDVLPFYHSNDSRFGSLVSTPGLPGYRKEVWLRAPVLRVQTLQFLAGASRIDVLKMDIEGAEWLMFRRRNKSLREWLKCSPPQQIAIEFHDRFYKKMHWVSRLSVQRLLRRCGYSRRHASLPHQEEVLFIRDRVASPDC